MTEQMEELSTTVDELVSAAVRVAVGEDAIADDAAPLRIVGASNDYNSRGRGSTMARRVLRDGVWKWLSAPASRGRFLAADRKDTQYGDAWVGEILASYTLGGRGTPRPETFLLVIGGEYKTTQLAFTRRRDGQYSVVLPGRDEKLVVSDPAWR